LQTDNYTNVHSFFLLIPEFCFVGDRRPFGQPVEKFYYEKGTILNAVENDEIEFKALTNEKPEKLPWKIMEKARVFICGVLNAGRQHGTIYFGIGDACGGKTDITHGEIIGLELDQHLKDEISKAFQNTLDDHITSDSGTGKMTRGGEMDCIKIYFVPVRLELNQNIPRCVVEIQVKHEWKYCLNQVYYVQEWSKKTCKNTDITNCFSKFFVLLKN
jgi:hypothetical protein